EENEFQKNEQKNKAVENFLDSLRSCIFHTASFIFPKNSELLCSLYKIIYHSTYIAFMEEIR
ncbi:hypothetical protein ACFOGI_07090, partial [Virgibacillus xinjiangensis]